MSVPLGKDEFNSDVVVDIHTLPHMLVCGATGSGKSTFLHSIINTLLMRNGPERLRFILNDAKRVEFSVYTDIPHLLTPIISDAKSTIAALRWLGKEMDRRYAILETAGVLNIESYHSTVVQSAKKDDSLDLPETMPYIVAIIDEFADYMSVYLKEMEAAIIRLTQMSRAVGIHLIISTSRPSIKVLTGMIKANIPSRIIFRMASANDSRSVLGVSEAEKLRGAGDMLWLSGDMGKPVRLKSAFISDGEVKKVTTFIIKNNEVKIPIDIGRSTSFGDDEDDIDDDVYEAARLAVIESGEASTSYIQRKLRVGYARAARLMDTLTERGVISEDDGAKPRKVIKRDPSED